jgi:double-stranded uracil-DNA glycosylase
MPSSKQAIKVDGPFKPTKQQLIDAAGKTLPDVIAPNLRVLFCGINPGLYTAAVGHHFARPGNRFWPALFKSGFTDRLLSPFEERQLLDCGLGISNVVPHATATAAELNKEDFIEGGRILAAKVKKYQPRIVAILGVGAYRTAFANPKATIGEQTERIHTARVWVLPNPSGLNANYQLPELVRLFAELQMTAWASSKTLYTS